MDEVSLPPDVSGIRRQGRDEPWGGVMQDGGHPPLSEPGFRDFDRQFNGYLFKVDFTEDLCVPGDVLADFVRSLYPPRGPVPFRHHPG